MPGDVSLHITRMPYAPLAATLEMALHISDPALVAAGYHDLRAVSPSVMAYACTSGSFIGGLAGQAALVSAMTDAGAPADVFDAVCARLHDSDLRTVVPETVEGLDEPSVIAMLASDYTTYMTGEIVSVSSQRA